MIQKPRFGANDEANFFLCLKKRIDEYFKQNGKSKHATSGMFLKTIAMLSLYLVPYLLMMTGYLSMWAMFGCVVVMAIGKAGIGMAVMHDANHGAYSDKKWLNSLMGGAYYLLGGSPAVWKIQHNVLHHTYTNVHEADEDIETKFLLRLSPYAPLKKVHRYQYIYAFVLYFLMTFSMLFKDFIKIFRYRRYDLIDKKISVWIDLSKEIIVKSIYFFFMIVLPYWVLNVSLGVVITGFLLLHFIAGLILGLVFQLAHSVTETEYFAVENNETLENTWAIHQLKTTANFAPNNWFLNWYVGGLNFQIEHHLFPHICHVHYPQLAYIVKQTASEFGLPYHEQPTFMSALRSHVDMLKILGKLKLEV